MTIIRDEYDIVRHVEELKALDLTKPHKATIEPYDPKNTNEQKKLYWKWIDEMCPVTGNYKYDQDEDLRNYILEPIYYKNAKGKNRETRKTISQLGKKEMSDFMDKVFTLAGSFGIVLTDPEDINAQ